MSTTSLFYAQRLLDHTDDLISYVDTNGIYRAVNRAYCQRYHKEPEAIIGLHVSELLGKEMFERNVKSNLLQALSGERVSYEAWFGSDAYTKQYNHVQYNPYYNDDGTIEGVIVTVSDQTQRKHFEEEQLRQEELYMMNAKMVQLGEMVSFLAHQWRQPLNTLSTMLLKLRRYLSGNREALTVTSHAESLLEHLSRDIENLYTFFEPDPFDSNTDIAECTARALHYLHLRLMHKNILVNLKIPEGLYIAYGTNEFLHVLLVLLENAVECLNNNDVESRSITIEASIVDARIVMHIKDNGPGIKNIYAKRIFEPAFSTKKESGHGFGLYFAQKVISRDERGTLELLDTVEGSCFRITMKQKVD